MSGVIFETAIDHTGYRKETDLPKLLLSNNLGFVLESGYRRPIKIPLQESRIIKVPEREKTLENGKAYR